MPDKEFHERFYKLVDDLVALNKEYRKNFPDGKKIMGRPHWAIEYCSIKVGFSRRIGKTKYIKSRATDKDLIVAFNKDSIRVLFKDAPCKVLVAYEVTDKGRIFECQTVYFDEFNLSNCNPAYVFSNVLADTYIFLEGI